MVNTFAEPVAMKPAGDGGKIVLPIPVAILLMSSVMPAAFARIPPIIPLSAQLEPIAVRVAAAAPAPTSGAAAVAAKATAEPMAAYAMPSATRLVISAKTLE
ncbi:hypothetical protein GCM10011513_16780 [Franconibacter daqui]|nr:hypothetical protein GCM10011513_16780 [Franconibacter daqui]